MNENDQSFVWDATDIKMAIKRYFAKLQRKDFAEAMEEIEFLRSIHREWSYHPLMRRCDIDSIAIIDDFLKWLEVTPLQDQDISDFTVRRLIR